MKQWGWQETATGIDGKPSEWSLHDGRGRRRCTISKPYPRGSFIWHTWNERGTGGENSECSSLRDAKDHAIAAIVRQGWAPGGWKVQW